MTQPGAYTFGNPDGSKTTLTFSFGDPTGGASGGSVTMTTSVQSQPAPPVTTLMVGDSFGLDLTDFPHDAYGILFNSPGKGVNTTAIASFPKDVLLLVCVKDAITEAMLRAMIAARGNYPLWIAWHQEPEGDLLYTDYQAGQIDLRNLMNSVLSLGQRALVKQVGKVTLYAEQHGKGPITHWFAGTPANPVEDIMGVDCYWTDSTAKAYPDPKTFYADPIAWAKAANVPLAITEWGLSQLPWDTDGSALADAITAHVAYLRDKALVAAWWNGKGTNHSYILTGKPLQALKDAMDAPV
jgi:hypothetical protein